MPTGVKAKSAPEAAQVEMVLAQIEALPTLPSVAVRLLELTSDAGASARQVIEVLASDQSLASRVLSAAQRADRGANAATVDRAVILLGFEAVRGLVLSIQVFETFAGRVEEVAGRLDLPGMWRHSLAVGCAAKLLAEALAEHAPKAVRRNGHASLTLPKPEEAFACGLLHDLGKVALNACFPKSYDRVVLAVEGDHACINDAEQRVFGLDHTLAGRRLAAHWKLPSEIAECIWLHHHHPEVTPKNIQHPVYVHLVQVADRLARQMRIGYSGNHATDRSAEQACTGAFLSPEILKRVMADLPELIEARSTLIGLERLTSKEICTEALLHANTELGRLSVNLAASNRTLEQRSRWFDALGMLARQGEHATHEDICRTTLQAVGQAANCWPAAVAAVSPSRGLCTIASATRPESITIHVLPRTLGTDADSLSKLQPAWLPSELLPRELLDQLRTLLGTAPAQFWPMRRGRDLLGFVACTADVRSEPEACVTTVLETAARLLAGAEMRIQSDRLAEELAEITRRLDASQAELARSRCIGMIGEMAAGAAHELNNPLAVISGRAQLLNRDGVSDEIRHSAAVIADHAHRASQMVSELMEFAKPAAPKPSRIQFSAFLDELRRRWLEKGPLRAQQFRLELSDDLPDVRADAAQIAILFDELIRNAVDAMQATPEPLLVVNCQSDSADEEVVISVEDNGCGMTADVMERAITPFFSHRPAGRGRGLGLSRAARYAEINGGCIRLSSGPATGTVVRVNLPAAAAAPDAQPGS